jgi:hypothetical protein
MPSNNSTATRFQRRKLRTATGIGSASFTSTPVAIFVDSRYRAENRAFTAINVTQFLAERVQSGCRSRVQLFCTQ